MVVWFLDKITTMTINYHSPFHPEYKTDGAAGFDLCADLSDTIIEGINERNEKEFVPIFGSSFKIPAQTRVKIPTGLFTDPQSNDYLWFLVALRSGIGWEKGLMMPHGIATIDKDFRGQWHLILYNPNKVPVTIGHGERIAQAVLLPYIKASFNYLELDQLTPTDRGTGGFGSTGAK